MDKSSRLDIALEDQRKAWNQWNATVRARNMGRFTEHHASIVDAEIARLGRQDLKLIEVGCGTGWLCERIRKYGSVTGTDLSDEVLAEARLRTPDIEYVAGDFMALDLPRGHYDVAVTLDTLSHFVDQHAFMAKVASLLRPGGWLIVATQNRPVLERWSAIPGPQPGQVRQWVDHRRLRQLLKPNFASLRITSVDPVGDQGLLRIVNSVKLNKLGSFFIGQARLDRLKERAMLGHSLIATAQR
jgi:SAM-dependent methyltransferase